MDQNAQIEADRKAAVLVERDSLLLTALLVELLRDDRAARSRIEMTLNMLSVENLKALGDQNAPPDRKALLASGIMSARSFIDGIPLLSGKLPESARRRPTTP